VLSPIWEVQSSAAAASEDQRVTHPVGLVTFVAASGELVLIDDAAAVVSQVTWSPPSATFELADAIEDSLVVTYAETAFAGVTLSTGTTDWQRSFAADATVSIAETTLLVAEPAATAFDVTRLDRVEGTSTAAATFDADPCELLEGRGAALAVAEHPAGAFAAHCATGGAGTPVLRVRRVTL